MLKQLFKKRANLYGQKLQVNHSRQDKGYAMSEKTEEDNRNITI